MRKNNDGYVIIYVVFVILFLCLVAVSTCTAALNNLKTQNAAAEQMQARYEAEGEMEKRISELCENISALNSSETLPEEDVRNAAINRIKEIFGTTNEPSKAPGISETEEIYTCICELSETKNNYTVKAKVEFRFKISFIHEVTEYTDNAGNKTTDLNEWPADTEIKTETKLYCYSVAYATCKYITYAIEYTGGDA